MAASAISDNPEDREAATFAAPERGDTAKADPL
jgi:hypothetical protein